MSSSPNPFYEFLEQRWRKVNKTNDGYLEPEPSYDDLLKRKREHDQRFRAVLKFVATSCLLKGPVDSLDREFLPMSFYGAEIEFDNRHGHIEMLLRLKEDCTIDDLRQGWNVIAEWQRRLLYYQGPCLVVGQPWREDVQKHLLWRELAQNKDQGGLSYQGLADKVNDEIAANIKGYVAFRRNWPGRFPEGEDVRPTGLNDAISIMENMGMPLSEASQWADDMLTNLESDKPAFLPDGGPTTRDMVISRVKAWRNMLKGVAKTG